MSIKSSGKKLIIVGMFCIAWLAGSGCEPTPVPFTLEGEMVTHTPPALLVELNPTSTPIPVPFRLTAVTKTSLTVPNFQLTGIDDNTAVGASTINGKRQIMLVDLTTGKRQQISKQESPEAKHLPRISARWVVWGETVSSPDVHDRTIMIYDREQQHRFQLAGRSRYSGEFDLSGDIVVWDEGTNQDTGVDIFAYDLAAQREILWLKLRGNQGLPRIWGQWVIYGSTDELHAYHLTSEEELEIGPLFFPTDARAGMQHAIAGHWVLWVNPKRELHVYDLERHNDRAMFPGTTTGEAFLKTLGSNLLVFHQNQRLGLYTLDSTQQHITLDVPELEGVSSDLFVSGNRVVWSGQDNKSVYLQIMRLTP